MNGEGRAVYVPTTDGFALLVTLRRPVRVIEELRTEVTAAWKEAQKHGTMTEGPWLEPATMFDDVYAETPQNLESQRRRMLEVERSV